MERTCNVRAYIGESREEVPGRGGCPTPRKRSPSSFIQDVFDQFTAQTPYFFLYSSGLITYLAKMSEYLARIQQTVVL